MSRVDVQYKIYMMRVILFDLTFLVDLGESGKDAAFGSGYTIEGFGRFEIDIFGQMFHKELILLLNLYQTITITNIILHSLKIESK
jgi:hypothetical protein